MIYFVLLFIMLTAALIFDINGNKKGKKNWYFVISIFLILLSGLRYRIGTDTITYENWFNSSGLPEIHNFQFSNLYFNRFEPLYVLFGSTIKSIFKDWIAFQLIHSIIVNGSFLYFIKKYSPYPFVGVIFYFLALYYPFNCEIMRQSLAMSIWSFSIPSLINKKYVNYFLFVVVAYLFHRSSIIYSFIPLILHFRSNKTLIWVLVSILFSAKALSGFITDNYLSIIMMFSSSDSVSTTLSNYSSSSQLMAYNFTYIGLISFILDNVLIYLICKINVSSIEFNCQTKQNSTKFNLYVFDNIFAFYIILQMLSLAFPIFYRFVWLVSIVSILYLSIFVVNSFRGKIYARGILVLIVLSVFSFKIYKDNSMNEDKTKYQYYERYYPYSSVIEKSISTEREQIINMYKVK